MSSNNLQLLNSLTEEEKVAVKNIIKEIAKTGKSEQLKDLYYEDYEEIPVDLETFLCDEMYLGKYTNYGKDIYDTWKKELTYVHNPINFVDQWAITGSTGTGKSTVATYSLCYELYKLMCLKDPNRFYLGANETIWFLFFNLNLKLAEKTMWGKFQKALQMSPWFMERGTVTGRKNLVYQPNKDIRLDIGSTEEHALSVAVMFVAIDEMSFGANDNVEYMQTGMMAIYNQLYLRLSSRFSKAGRIQGRMYLISSAKSTNAVLESFIRDNEGEPGMHVSRYKQWEVLPASKFSGKWFKIAVGNELLTSYIMGVNINEEEVKEAEMKGYTVIDVPLEMKHRFEMDFNRTLIDSCGISVQSSYKYIPYRIVEPCLGTGINAFSKEIIKTGLKDNLQIKDFFLPEVVPEILYSKKIYIHCDLSKSGDMTGISAVAVLGYKNQERFTDTGDSTTLKEMVFRHIFSVGLQCPPNDELSMIKVKDFLHYLKYDLGWNIAGVSCDGYQSLMLLQSLKLDGFTVKEVSMDIVKNKEDVGYTVFRNVLIEQRIKLLKLNELIKEITNLERNELTGKVDHPKQCLTGDTKIRMLDGSSKTILQLLNDYENNIPNYVYTFNEQKQIIEPKLIKNVWFTGYRNDIYKITLDNGKIIECTSNHPFMLRNGQYLEASKLQIGQSLMPLYTKIANKGLKGYRMYFEPIEGKWHYEHTQFDPVRKYNYNKGNITHHANYNKLDNRPCNLKYITKSQHTKIHNRVQSNEERNKRSKTIKLWHQKNKNTEQYKLRTERTIQSLKKYNQKHKEEVIQRHKNIKLSDEAKEKMSRKNERLYTNGKVRKYFKIGQPIPKDFVKCESQAKLHSKKYNLTKLEQKLVLNINKKIKQEKKRLSILNNKLYKQLDTFTKPDKMKNRKMPKRPYKLKRSTQINNLKLAIKKIAYCKLNSNKPYSTLTKSELYKAGTIFRNIGHPELKNSNIKQMNKCRWYTNGIQEVYTKDIQNIPIGFYPGRCKTVKNHKIIAIEKINTYKKVYDLEIEENHNFALDAGIFVHNSVKILDDGTKVKSVGKDISDSLGGAIYNATLSVDVNELDYMDSVILADGGLTTLTNSQNPADRFFGINRNINGTISLQPEVKPSGDINEDISKEIQKQVNQSQQVVQQIKKDNPNTKLTNEQIKDLYNDFIDDGFIIM